MSKNTRKRKRKVEAGRPDHTGRPRQLGQSFGKSFALLDNLEQANSDFSAYYKQQLPCLRSPEGWEQFVSTLASPLPVTIRLNVSAPTYASFRKRLSGEFRYLGQFIKVGAKALPNPVDVVPWIEPKQSAWQVNTDRNGLRKCEALQGLYDFIQREMTLGHLSRQELVSMIPACMLDIQPHHYVMDMCASPGSKTRQIMELMQKDSNCKATGFLMANDSDIKRTEHLRRQFARAGGPMLVITAERGEDVLQQMGGKGEIFDRILCDVPCSGDGTFRKAPEMWKNWSIGQGLDLHSIQLQLACATAALTKVGGRFVYSTCSLNPMEDEAVVAMLLRASKGSLQLVDASQTLPLFRRMSGLTTWIVPEEFQSMTTLQPPTPQEAKEMELPRCLRILPHVQDTGGFFVAVFQKISPFVMPESISQKVDAEQSKKILQGLGFEVVAPKSREAHKHQTLNKDEANSVQKSWDLDEKSRNCLFTSPKDAQSIQLGTPAVLDVLQKYPGLRVVAAGVTILQRSSNMKEYHVHPDGIHVFLAHIQNQHLPIAMPDFRTLLRAAAAAHDKEIASSESVGEEQCTTKALLSMATIQQLSPSAQHAIKGCLKPSIVLSGNPSAPNPTSSTNSSGDPQPTYKRKMSAAERKKMKKITAADQNGASNPDLFANRAPGSTDAGSGYPMTLILRREGSSFRILTPADRVQSYCEALSA